MQFKLKKNNYSKCNIKQFDLSDLGFQQSSLYILKIFFINILRLNFVT